MRVIELHASGWVTVLDFLGALKVAIGAPAWHGDSPDAFIDSMIWGGINAVEPPYEIRVIEVDALPREIRDYVLLIAQVLMDARAEHRVRKGWDVNVTLTLSPALVKVEEKPMTKKIRQILKHGTWLYDGTVKADVWIIRQSYFEGPTITDEEPTPGYPPTDAEGCFYFPEYRIPGAGGGNGSGVFGSMEVAVRRAESVLKSPIVWD